MHWAYCIRFVLDQMHSITRIVLALYPPTPWGHQVCEILLFSLSPSYCPPHGASKTMFSSDPPPGPTGGNPQNYPRFETLFLMQLFGAQIPPKGQPQVSIVANLAPKMTPTRNPKWTHSDTGRPLRNMHKHCTSIPSLGPQFSLDSRPCF